MTLTLEKFTRRWSLHILPRGYTKTRRFGGWSNTRRELYLARCAIQLETMPEPLSADATMFDVSILKQDQDASDLCAVEEQCPVCGAAMRLIDCREKPSWRDILSSPHRPRWYGQYTLQRHKLALRAAGPIEFAKGQHACGPSPTRQSSTPDLSG